MQMEIGNIMHCSILSNTIRSNTVYNELLQLLANLGMSIYAREEVQKSGKKYAMQSRQLFTLEQALEIETNTPKSDQRPIIAILIRLQ